MSHDAVVERLRSGQIDLVRVLWCDNANVIRTKSIFLPPLLAADRDLAQGALLLEQLNQTITITAALQSLPVSHDEPAAEAKLAPVKDVRLVPDWDSLATCPATPSVATVIGDMVDGTSPWAHCPREYLRRVQQQALELGIAVEAGFEIEFFLLQPGDDPNKFPAPIDQTLYASTVAAQTSASVIGEMLQALWNQGVAVEQYYPESGPGQQEITLAHCSPLRLADRLVMARETIRAVAAKHGLIASFVPLLFEDATGSGMHVHWSLWNDGKSLMASPDQKWGLSQIAESFMAGILTHLPALMATTTPSVNSYRRIRPHEWSGAFQAWGVANKEAAIRLIDDATTGQPRHVELKTVDPSANPYIALASMIAAGLDGVKGNGVLPEPVTIDPGDLTDQQRAERGISTLPTSLSQSITQFAADPVLRTAMGDDFATAFIAVRRAELNFMRGMPFEEERRLLLQRY